VMLEVGMMVRVRSVIAVRRDCCLSQL
jgi:hypothetical protein